MICETIKRIKFGIDGEIEDIVEATYDEWYEYFKPIKYFKKLYLMPDEYDIIKGYLYAQSDDEYMDEGDTISKTVIFQDGYEMDIRCCGCDGSPSYAEAVLFLNGSAVIWTDPDEEFLGTWELEYKGISYVVEVEVCNEFR